MKLKIYQVDAFATRPFEGNPAAVVPLDSWLPDAFMQSIASENNLSETAFFIPTNSGFHIRWFSPNQEVKLCGHATIASAFVLFEKMNYQKARIDFESLSGILSVSKKGNLYELDFPKSNPVSCVAPAELLEAFGWNENILNHPGEKENLHGAYFLEAENKNLTGMEFLKAEDYMVVMDSEEAVLSAKPKMEALMKLDLRGVMITAPSKKYDFVSRFFAPKFGIPEDPVTGSSFTQLGPYWAKRLGKEKLFAKQISERGGEVRLAVTKDRVLISGGAALFMQGEIEV